MLIKKCSIVRFPIHFTDVIGMYRYFKQILFAKIVLLIFLSNILTLVMNNVDDWQKLLEECLSHEVSAIKLKAAEAHTKFFMEYYADIDYNTRSIIINRYLESLQSSNQAIRIGFAQAIGRLRNLISYIKINFGVIGLILE